jgi:ribonuclease HI
LKTVYTGAVPLILHGAPVWKGVLNRSCHKAKLVRTQRLIKIRIAKAYRTVSNDALYIITGVMPMDIKIGEATKYYEITKGEGPLCDREMEVKNWIHPAKQITIIDGHEDSTHYIHTYTDGSKNEACVVSGIAVFSGCSLKTLKYRLNERCTNNQAGQMTILKALEYTQHLKEEEKTVLVYTDSKITLQSLQNQKRHTHLIDQIRNKVLDMERHEWKVEFSWMKAHMSQRRNELADCLTKEASRSKNIEECYNRVPKSMVSSELKEQCLKQWQNEWEGNTKGATTKSFFPIIVDRLKLRINPTPNFTAIVRAWQYKNIPTQVQYNREPKVLL